jgi:signal peptidase I (EC:3.4.21.89). Serine peptidase. MEROPS family S26A
MKKAAVGIIRDIFIALVLAVFIRTFAVQAYKIPSGSMIPTLLVGDYILVNRLAYGLRIPYYKYIFKWGEIKRGDVIVFVFPEDPSKDFIKRVIALPSETIEIRKKKIYIDGKEIEDKWGFFSDDYFGPPRDDFGPFKVPPGHVFVMGDNRDESNDSRFWGPVNIQNIKGKAFVIYFSWDSNEKSVRFNRIFSLIR